MMITLEILCVSILTNSFREDAKVKFEPLFSQISAYNYAKISKTRIFMFECRFFYIGRRGFVKKKMIWVIFGSKKQNVTKVTCFAELEN